MLFERRKAKQLVLLVSLHYASLQFFGFGAFGACRARHSHTPARLGPAATADPFSRPIFASKDAQLRQHKSASRRRDQQANHVFHPELLLVAAQAPRPDFGAGRQQRNSKKKYQAHERRPFTSLQRQSCFSLWRF